MKQSIFKVLIILFAITSHTPNKLFASTCADLTVSNDQATKLLTEIQFLCDQINCNKDADGFRSHPTYGITQLCTNADHTIQSESTRIYKTSLEKMYLQRAFPKNSLPVSARPIIEKFMNDFLKERIRSIQLQNEITMLENPTQKFSLQEIRNQVEQLSKFHTAVILLNSQEVSKKTIAPRSDSDILKRIIKLCEQLNTVTSMNYGIVIFYREQPMQYNGSNRALGAIKKEFAQLFTESKIDPSIIDTISTSIRFPEKTLTIPMVSTVTNLATSNVITQIIVAYLQARLKAIHTSRAIAEQETNDAATILLSLNPYKKRRIMRHSDPVLELPSPILKSSSSSQTK